MCVFKECSQSSGSFLLLHMQGFTFIRGKEIARALSDLSSVWGQLGAYTYSLPNHQGLVKEYQGPLSLSQSVDFPLNFSDWSVSLLTQAELWPQASCNIGLLKLFAIISRVAYHLWQYPWVSVLHSKANQSPLVKRLPVLTACRVLVKNYWTAELECGMAEAPG